jgi:hypothetical protein
VKAFTIDSPSEIQREDDLVGMAIPTAPLSWAKSGMAESAAVAPVKAIRPRRVKIILFPPDDS